MVPQGRLRLFLMVIGGVVLLALILFGIQVLGFYQLLRNGNTDLLAAYQFTNQLTVGTALAAAPVERADVATSDDPTLGKEGAPVTVVEFLDFGCPFSRDESGILRELVAKYPDTVSLQVRDFPLTELHPDAERASRAGACAHTQGKFWALHDKLFANPTSQTDVDLMRYAKEIGLDEKAFTACFVSQAVAKEVADDVTAGTNAGVRGTPTFFINGVKIEGAIPADAWEHIVTLAQKK